jgi:cobalamin synthase
MRLVPPARVDGLGREALKGVTLGHARFALLIGWLPLAIMFGVGGLLALTLWGIVAWFAGVYARARGDVLGAMQVLGEIAILFVLTSSLSH